MAYVFRGTDFAEPKYLSEPLPATNCGTRAGYRWHQNNGDPICDECAAAHADYMREYMRKYRPLIQHGTMTAYRAHLKAQETPCDECKAVNATYQREYSHNRRHVKVRREWSDKKCGTVAGYAAHYRYGVDACEPCKKAYSLYRVVLRIKKQSAETGTYQTDISGSAEIHSLSTGTAA